MLGRMTRAAYLFLLASNVNNIEASKAKSRKERKRLGLTGRNSENYVPRLGKAPRRKARSTNDAI
jgi:hypothetical protein